MKLIEIVIIAVWVVALAGLWMTDWHVTGYTIEDCSQDQSCTAEND